MSDKGELCANEQRSTIREDTAVLVSSSGLNLELKVSVQWICSNVVSNNYVMHHLPCALHISCPDQLLALNLYNMNISQPLSAKASAS